MSLRLFFLAASSIFLLSFGSCDSSRYKSDGRILATGKVGEILVVCNQDLWDTEIKNYLDTGLTRFITPYMPDVATFELVHRLPSKFEGPIKKHRNVLFITVDPKRNADQAEVSKRIGVWADDQVVIDLVASNYNQLLDLVKGGLNKVHAEYDDASWRRIMEDFERNPSEPARTELKENFGITVEMPTGARIVTRQKNFYRVEFPDDARPMEFVGFGQDPGTIFTGVMVYQYDYIDSTQLDPKNLLMARDTMLKYNVPYEIDGMYMGTQYTKLLYPEWSQWTTADGKIQGTEIRGMFVFTGLRRFGGGGAFWEFHFVHPKRKKVVCVSAYLDAPPTTSWTHFIREAEAILKSVKIAE